MKPDKEKLPLLTAMYDYIADGAVGYHTPGHKQGKGIPDIMRELITADGLKMEVSLMEELDDLHAPATYLKKSQALAADLYGAAESFFVINGTTGAIHAMILAVVGDGDKLILPRNAHRSVSGALVLSGARPVYMQPELDAKLGIAMPVTPKTVEAAIREHPDAKAVLLVNPTYYGVTADLKRIAELVHAAGMLLLIDEAHGPHLKFSTQLPQQALDCGADIVAQSTHKITGALTQCSLLHIQGERAPYLKLRKMLSLLQSTSPNYLLLASLEAACCQLSEAGSERINEAVRLARWCRTQINAINGLYCFGRERLAACGAHDLDETKLTVHVSGLGLSGPEAEQLLRHHFKIQAELADAHNVLFIISYADGKEQARYLVEALRNLAANFCRHEPKQLMAAMYAELPRLCLTPRQAAGATLEKLPFKACAGRIAGETLTFYPPGIPLLCPGEEIRAEMIEYCQSMQKLGLKVVGPADTTLHEFYVIKTEGGR